MFEKRKRIVDKALLSAVKLMRCRACGKSPCDPHHVTTRGAGGDDVPENVMPLCHQHHVEWHAKGARFMQVKYAGIRMWLIENDRQDVVKKGEKDATPTTAVD